MFLRRCWWYHLCRANNKFRWQALTYSFANGGHFWELPTHSEISVMWSRSILPNALQITLHDTLRINSIYFNIGHLKAKQTIKLVSWALPIFIWEKEVVRNIWKELIPSWAIIHVCNRWDNSVGACFSTMKTDKGTLVINWGCQPNFQMAKIKLNESQSQHLHQNTPSHASLVKEHFFSTLNKFIQNTWKVYYRIKSSWSFWCPRRADLYWYGQNPLACEIG